MKKLFFALALAPLLGACATPEPPVPTIAQSLANTTAAGKAGYLKDECLKEASHQRHGKNGDLGHSGTTHVERLKQICAEIPNLSN